MLNGRNLGMAFDLRAEGDAKKSPNVYRLLFANLRQMQGVETPPLQLHICQGCLGFLMGKVDVGKAPSSSV